MTPEVDALYPATMSLHALAEACRANDIRIGEATLGRHILAGNLPFAHGAPSEDGHNAVYLISRHGAYIWIADFTGREPIRVTIT